MNKKGNEIIAVCNFCPVTKDGYRIGVPEKGTYKCVFSSDKKIYGGKGERVVSAKSKDIPMHRMDNSIGITIPALSVSYYKLIK